MLAHPECEVHVPFLFSSVQSSLRRLWEGKVANISVFVVTQAVLGPALVKHGPYLQIKLQSAYALEPRSALQLFQAWVMLHSFFLLLLQFNHVIATNSIKF